MKKNFGKPSKIIASFFADWAQTNVWRKSLFIISVIGTLGLAVNFILNILFLKYYIVGLAGSILMLYIIDIFLFQINLAKTYVWLWQKFVIFIFLFSCVNIISSSMFGPRVMWTVIVIAIISLAVIIASNFYAKKKKAL